MEPTKDDYKLWTSQLYHKNRNIYTKEFISNLFDVIGNFFDSSKSKGLKITNYKFNIMDDYIEFMIYFGPFLIKISNRDFGGFDPYQLAYILIYDLSIPKEDSDYFINEILDIVDGK